MTDVLVYWAQALDNASPDLFEVGGEELPSDDSGRREEAASLVSDVVKSGARIFDRSGVALTDDGRRYVLEVPSDQRDQIGRTAPIVCCGEYTTRFDASLAGRVILGIEDFASRIGRSLKPEHLDSARSAFDELKKKSLSRRRVRMLAIAVAVVIIAAAVYALTSRGS